MDIEQSYKDTSGAYMRCLSKIVSIITVFSLMVIPLFAGTTGKIVGQVTDSKTGDALVGANLIITGTSLGASTDADGYYSIINIPPGTYQIEVYYVGYANHAIGNVRVNVDRTTSQSIKMSSETIEGETVLVEAERPPIEIDRTHSSSIVSAETVELMPVTEIDEVLELQAGVVSTDGRLHFRGGRAREVAYIIDGVPVSDAFSEDGGRNVVVENGMIEELEVISGTFNAEYGSAQSGVVNIVTKRPQSQFRGSLQVYTGEWLSNEEDIYIGVSDFDPAAEKDVQFSLSGPIFKEKLGFNLSGRYNDYQSLEWYERRFNTIDGWRIAAYQRWFQQHNAGQVNNNAVIRIPDSLMTGDGQRGPLRTGFNSSLNGKLVYQPHPKVTLSYQGFGSFDEFEGPSDPLNFGNDRFRRYAPDDAGTVRQWAHSHFFRFQHFPSENFFYNLAASYQRNDGEAFYTKDNDLSLFPGDPGIQLFNAFSQGGFLMGGTQGLYGGQDGRGFRDQYLVNGDFNWQIDKYNFIKAGFLVKRHFINVFSRGFRATPEWTNNQWPLQNFIDGADYEFAQYWNLLSDYWRNWENIFGTDRIVEVGRDEVALYRDFNIEPSEFAVYIQDKMELGDVIINGGLRFDMFMPNERVPVNFRTESFNLGNESNLTDATTKYQVSPRIGLSFPISSTGAFHGSYGHFFQMPSFTFMYNEPYNVLNRFQLDGRLMGNADLEAEKTIAYEIGLQQAVNDYITVDVTAYYKDFRNLLGVEQINTVDAISYRRFVNRDYGNTKGLSVDFEMRGDLISGGANYSLAYANGSASDPEALDLINTATQIGGEDVVFPQRKILPLDWDQRHSVNAFVNFSRRSNWSIGLVGFFYTGVPFSPEFVGRFDLPEREYNNAANRPNRWGLDLKAKKHLNIAGLKSSIFLQVDNLFDHLNEVNVYPTSGRAGYFAILPEEAELLLEGLEQEGLNNRQEVVVQPDFWSSPRKIQLGFEIKY